MVDGSGRSRLADEPLPERIVTGEFGRQDLERHPPVQPGIVRAEDNSHPATADLLLEPVAGHLRARSEPARCRGDLVTHRASSGCLPVPSPRANLRRSWRQDRPGQSQNRRGTSQYPRRRPPAVNPRQGRRLLPWLSLILGFSNPDRI